jgi:transcriptional regulator with XRE-family HTH domain
MTEKELREIFCRNIKEYRGRNNWSQVALAQKAGVSVNFINDIESGKKWASPATMLKIAAAFNIYVYELLKPPGLLPDNVNSIIRKYTDNVNEAIEGIRLAFLKDVK